MRRGVIRLWQYLVARLAAGSELIFGHRRPVRRLRALASSSAARHHLSSARGGAGSVDAPTTPPHAVSERIGANTVIVDYDLPFGTAGLDFNQDPLNGRVADALTQLDTPGSRPAGSG